LIKLPFLDYILSASPCESLSLKFLDML
jgi:hypothetical protein